MKKTWDRHLACRSPTTLSHKWGEPLEKSHSVQIQPPSRVDRRSRGGFRTDRFRAGGIWLLSPEQLSCKRVIIWEHLRGPARILHARYSNTAGYPSSAAHFESTCCGGVAFASVETSNPVSPDYGEDCLCGGAHRTSHQVSFQNLKRWRYSSQRTPEL